MKYFIGVDVGTSSVRAGIFNENGYLIDFTVYDINVYNSEVDHYEQSSTEIWNAVCACVKRILQTAHIQATDVLSIGFDATCSLVVLDSNKFPLSVSKSKDNLKNVIMWMDHRAKQEADFINSTKHERLNNVGGKISPEMDPPKILWLKRHLYENCYAKAGYFLSLPDYLFWRSTNTDVRSMCCVVCKWLYEANEGVKQWDQTFWSQIGLGDLCDNHFDKIGSVVEEPFKYLKNGSLTELASAELGLTTHTKVGISLIDAHAGGVGAIAITMGALENLKLKIGKELPAIYKEDILVIVSGTSACHMSSSLKPVFVNGIWGPYYSAMLPNTWLNEAGQSACGKLLDHIITTHPAYNDLKELSNSTNVFDTLSKVILDVAKSNGLDSSHLGILTRDIHVYPDFHGNRSPLSDPNMKGSICGLTFNNTLQNLALLYLAILQSLAFQTKQIIDHISAVSNDQFKLIVIIGGLAKNNFYTQLHADICSIPVIIPEESDSAVLLGSCISGACNTEYFQNKPFDNILKAMSGTNEDSVKYLLPNTDDIIRKFYSNKMNVFMQMLQDQLKYNRLMEN